MGTKPQKSKKPLVFKGFLVVPEEGLEPSRTCVRQILSLLRLPLRHSGQVKTQKVYQNRQADTTGICVDASRRNLPACISPSFIPHRNGGTDGGRFPRAARLPAEWSTARAARHQPKATARPPRGWVGPGRGTSSRTPSTPRGRARAAGCARNARRRRNSLPPHGSIPRGRWRTQAVRRSPDASRAR